ncbi:uncharacterized protein LOC134539987 [Bacillus rossius redtenbacheri]|uniref:uncharacterized protein LOC134539987 n=1 Tax=Bacillus rossius redtenbacheri TaxID=93214 RepID=UPI002FDE6407
MGRKAKPLPIPEQDRRLCRIICLCQLTLVLSGVALVYLTVAIYMPSHRAFQSGIEPTPVTCHTVNTFMQTSYCDWASCGEWCLTRTAGFCPQIEVQVRRNGTQVRLEGCRPRRLVSIACPQVDPEALKKFNCNNGTECSALTGVFNCSLGHCANMSELYQCAPKADGIVVNSEHDNMKLNGFFSCYKSTCVKIKQVFYCTRYCPKISTTGVNVYLLYEDSVYTGECERAVALDKANGSEDPVPLADPAEFWRADNDSGVLMASCLAVSRHDTTLSATDCVNGSLVDQARVPKLFMNFTVLWSLYEQAERVADLGQWFAPQQSQLVIYNRTKLYINLEACVNTLQGECKQFLNTHGRDGDNHTAPSRFPCYYDKSDSSFVVARFDLRKTWRELLIAALVPSTLFLLSAATLCVITRSVTVGDDARMHCKYCGGGSPAGGEPVRTGPDDETDNEESPALGPGA